MNLQKIKSGKTLEFFTASSSIKLERPFMESTVQAGFPSPAEDFSEVSIDLNMELLKNPSSTFFCKVSGDSMKDLGINDGDMLVVDKSLEPKDGQVAVCFVDGDFTLKKIKIEKNCCWLLPANKNYEPIKITEENEFMVWGVVTYSIKSF